MLELAWPCGHIVKAEEARCEECYLLNLYGDRGGSQGEKVKLFEPAPEQLPGQLSF